MSESTGSDRPSAGARSAEGSGKLWTPMELIRVTAEFLADKGIDSPRLDAELLLAHVLDSSRLQLYLDHERPIVPVELDRYRELVRRRAQRIPLQLLVGSVEILDHEFLVHPGVFIPRPETEVLIETCRGLDFREGSPSTLLEVGVGTGCIGLSLLAHWPEARLIGYDPNPEALALTHENALRIGVQERLELREGRVEDEADWPGCDLLVSNPPYVADAVIDSLEPEVRDHDPREALAGGADGLDLIRRLATEGTRAVRSGGWIALEHGDDQGESVPALLRTNGWEQVALHRDLADRPRVSVGRRP